MRKVLRVLLGFVMIGSASTAMAQQRPTTPAVPTRVAPAASSVTSPHGPELREACASCHRADAWKPARISSTFKHAERTFPLAGAHERATCGSCHKQLDFQGVTTSCASCHSDPHKGEFGVTCARCHNTRSFVDRGTAVRTHQSSRFPLRGAHAIATCESCHIRTGQGQMQFAARSSTCQSCHAPTFRATKSPNHVAAHFSQDCASCHTISTWTGAAFDHNTTKFALTGKHQVATCAGCHTDNVYTGRSMACVSCHQSDYLAAAEPKHSQGFPTACESCHGTAQWKGARFDHQTQTKYPLTGKHVAATCVSCHKTGTYAGTPSTCLSCHQPDRDRTAKPPHQAAGFAATCESCHSTATWLGAPFDHATTRFALTGNHRAVTCAGCHADNVFRGKPMACASCHQGKADATTNPNHTAARFAATCESCHTTTAWAGAQFDHAQTRFPLVGQHVPQTCLACHSDRVYAGKPTVCVSCHQRNFDGTTQPNHRQLGFPTACETCHTPAQWLHGQFDHATTTRFALTGAHLALNCSSCHADGVFRGKPMTCVGCHQGTYDATTAPHHTQARFATTCESCHSTQRWTGTPFNHNATRFPLLGKHVNATCLACHSDRVYAGKPSVCQSCHQRDFDATTRPNHRTTGIPTTCESCHNVNGWQSTTFNHDLTQFPLSGAHRAVNCQSCHGDGVYKGKPTTCVNCHQAKFDATTTPNHRTAGYSTTCQTCHTDVAWKPAAFDHSRFPLVGAHRTASCEGCHADNVFRGKPTSCVSCHQGKFDASTKPNHRASGIATTCESCHTATAWTPATYDHATTRFPLAGAHRAVSCAGCHADGVYRGKTMTCVGCHQAKFDATTQPNHRTSGYSTTCETCHTVTAWKPAGFDHALTRFPLVGAHRSATCLACHADNVYRGKPMTCVSCHQTKFDATTRPNHRNSGIATTCESCHTATAWTPATYDHAVTRFPLAGAHRAVSCAGCHADGVYRGKTMTCVGCHQAKFDATTQPNHRTSGYSTTCETCHTVTAWKPAGFDHATTRFPLVGAHRSATCLACHADNVYRGKPMTCVSCHQTKFDATTRPNHRNSGIATTCESCHTATAWTPATYDHAVTRFPLAGAHRAVSCAGCHADGVYRGKTMTCVGCHQAKFDATTQPNHRTSGYSTTCETCHTVTAWKPAGFDHATTRFPLVGAHRSVTCLACHSDNVYAGKPMTCVSCHQAKFDATTRPNHRTSGIATTCETCHTATAWTPATYDHSLSRFPLAGAHRAVSCAGCHGDGVYRGKTMTCVGCHQAKFDASTRPNHRTSGFPTTCETCHTAVAWTPASFDHAATRFPLAGAHRTVTCQGCHGDGVFRGKVMTCIGCHQNTFISTNRPDHSQLGYSTTCTSCHNETAWVPSTWSHNTTTFPLTGAHIPATCLACHSDGVYRGKPKICSACHTPEFNATTNPNHRTAGFPITCESCHTTTRWTGATFNHDPWFPIYSGSHRGKWTTCTQCHANPSNYREFTCLSCHEHNQTSMDSKHRGRSGYRYESASCYSCHPRGNS